MRKGNIYFTREKHSAGYTCISNKCLQDTRLSLKARGLLVQILSLPENWVLYKSEIGKYNADKKHSINTAIAELETLGYLFSKKIKGNLIYKVVEAPEGTINIFDVISSENQNYDVGFEITDDDFKTVESRKTSSPEVENQPLLINNLNNIKLTTTKVVSQSLNVNEELKKLIETRYGFVFSEDFYSKLSELEKERRISSLDYVDWLINKKGKNAESIQNYVYKTIENVNVINEYIRHKKDVEKQINRFVKKEKPVICPECKHKFENIDFVTRKCACGLPLREIQAREGGLNG